VTDLSTALGVSFDDPELARMALTHRSYAFEQGLVETNERLEFLGDAVLGFVVTDMAFRQFPALSEGDLTKIRKASVNMHALAEIARELGLGELILLGRGEEMSGGRDKASILADGLEAIIGALYVDRGLTTVAALIERLFAPRIASFVAGESGHDHKTDLQEMVAREMGSLPEYRLAERGPDHQKEFTATVYLWDEPWGVGLGGSKKEAEQQAAAEACARLAQRHPVAKGG
jgi:ribonuclease-3